MEFCHSFPFVTFVVLIVDQFVERGVFRKTCLSCVCHSSSPSLEKRGLVSKETVVLRWWGSETRKFGLSTELTM